MEKKTYYNQRQNKANQKYQKEKLSQVRFWVKKEEKIAVQQEAEARGLSMKRFIAQAINTMAGKQLISSADLDDDQDRPEGP